MKKSTKHLVYGILGASVVIIILFGTGLLSVLDEVNINNVLTEQTAIETINGERVASYKLSTGPAFDDDEELGGKVVFYYNESGLGNPLKIVDFEFFKTNQYIFEQIPVQPNKTFCAKVYRSGLADDDDEGRYEVFDFVGWVDSDDRWIYEDEYQAMENPIEEGCYVTIDSSKSIYDYVGRNGIYFNEDFSVSKNKEGLEYFVNNILINGRFYTPDGSNRGSAYGSSFAYDEYVYYELCFNNNPLYPELENTSCWHNWAGGLSVYTHETCLLTSTANEIQLLKQLFAANKTVQDRIDIINELHFSIPNQAELIAQLNISNDERIQMIQGLYDNSEDQAYVLKEIGKVNEEDMIDIIVKMSLEVDSYEEYINEMLSLIEDDQNEISRLSELVLSKRSELVRGTRMSILKTVSIISLIAFGIIMLIFVLHKFTNKK